MATSLQNRKFRSCLLQRGTFAVYLAAMDFVGCSTPTPSAPVVLPTREATALGAGDIFEVRVYQEPDLSGVYRVSSSGTIDFPLLGKVAAAGQSSSALSDTLTARLKDGFIKNPQVSVLVKEYNSKKVFVLGQVARPGAFPYSDDMSVVNAVALAGGLTRIAAANQTNVTRVIDGKEQRFPVHLGDIDSGQEKNFQLAPGDIVYVPESFF